MWFQQALAIPGLGAQLVSEQRQRLPRYLFEHFTLDAASWSAQVIETYVAQLREPDRARAASSLYRHLVLPESLRILWGDYRRIRLPTPTLLLFGAADSAFPPALANRVLQDHRTVPITWKLASSRVPRTSSPARGRMPWLITLSNSSQARYWALSFGRVGL